MSQPYLSFLSAHAGRRARSALDARHRVGLHTLPAWLNVLVVLVQVMASFSAAATGAIQPAALAPLVGSPRTAQAAAPSKVASAKPPAIKSANAAPVNKPAFAAISTQSTITGVVFHDVNGNGVNDSEPGINGVTVTALCATDTGPDNILGGRTGNSQDDVYATYTATTASTGAYAFTNVAGWPCRIFFATPSGYFPGPHGLDSQGAMVLAPSVDDNGNPAAGAGNLSLPPATFTKTVNYGLVQTGDTTAVEFSGYLWADGDNDGVIEPGEPAWAGTPVKLFAPGADPLTATPVATVQTGADGRFYFSSRAGTDTTSDKFGLTLSANTAGYNIIYDVSSIPSFGVTSTGRGEDRCFSSSGVLISQTSPRLIEVSAASPALGLSPCNNAGLGHSSNYQYDFGDAPDSYHTSAAHSGAYEAVDINSNVRFLGPCITTDASNHAHDGAPFDVDFSAALPSINADGDDKHSAIAGCSQDDGVTFSPMVPGQDMVITLTAPSRYTSLYLNAWFDWNGNGVFDSNERVIDGGFAGTGCDLSADGGNTRPGALNFYDFATTPVTRIIHVPSNVTLASGAPGVYSRFRVNSTCYTTPPDGPGPNGFGEVEDYVTPVPSLMGAIKLVKQTTGGDGIFAFTSSNASLDQSITTVGGTGSSSVILLTAGIYTVTENALSGWNTTGINITGDTNNNSTTSVGSRQAVIHLDAGENTTVTFANNKVTTSGQLIVRKAAPVVTNCVALNHSDTTDPNAGNNAACVGLTVVPTNAVGVNFNFTDNVLMANGVLTPTFALQMGQAITFTSVVSGAYIVTETQQAGWQLANASCSNGDAPQHVSVPTGATVTCTFTNTQATAQFGDRVWLESDHDGLASTGALTPVAGLRITATASSGQVYTATTNAAGYYSFTVPANVTYTVQYGAAPASYGVVMPSSTPGGNHESGNAGSYQASGNPDQAHSQATTVFLQAGEANWHVDFAFTPVLVSLGNLVWYDTNNNGQVDTGEYGISGVKVSLYQDANSDGAYTPGVDTFITTTTTSASGYYSFTNLAPSSSLSTRYLVVIAGANFVSGGTLAYYQSSTGSVSASNTTNSQDNGVDGTLNTSGLGGYIASRAIDLTVGAQPTNDGDTSTSNPLTAAVGVADTLPNPSNTNWTVDFGFYKLTLGNQLWYDQNNNGLYEPANGETGLSGVPVALLSGGTVVLTTTTDAQGVYTFTGLISGTYQVRITAPTGLVSTQDTANSSATSNVDSNDKGPGVAGGVITSQNFRLTPGNQSGAVTVSNSTGATVNPTLDFGLIQFVKLGNRLWIESDNDGDATTGTVTPVIGQVVTATSNSGQVYTATTDANGLYTITVLANATYTVTTGTPAGTVASTVITNVANDSNAAAKNDKNHLNTGTTVTVVTTDNLSVDFGFHALAAQFGDRVWLESDTDGLANTGSITPVVGLVITATNSSSGVVYTATTDAQGYYSFTAPAGTYTVHYGRVPASYGAVIPSATPGGNRESGNAGSYQQSSNPDQSHVNGTTVTVAAGEANWHIDFAFWLPQPKIHLTKYTNGDDADLPTGPTVGVGSVVTWTYAITNTGNVTLTNVKLVDDQEGSVTCPQAQLAPGSAMTCILTGTAKAGQYANTAVVTGTPTLGPVTPVTSTNPSHYLGLTAGLGDRVWYDANHNGVQDLGENGVPNVTVQLLNNSGAVIRTTTTGATGYYSFTNLTPGVYAVRFVTSTLPAGYQLTTLNSGSDKTADSDANVNTGKTTSIPLVANQYDPTWDAGIWLPQPSILLKKYTNGYDADTVTGPYLAVGQVVTWTYTLTNTGNVTLTNITLRDNVEGRVTCTPTTLAPGAGTSCTQTGIAQAGQYSNTAVVTGTPTLGPVTPVTSTNPSHYFGAKPDVVLKKYTNGYDADTLSDARPHLHLGDPVTWTYIITNTGNVPLRFAANSLKDDKEGVIPHAFTLLPGESQTLTQHGFATTVGVYTNIGSIPAIPVMPPPAPDIPTFPPSNPPKDADHAD
ncbi:MAG: SdrD B-like domain-containing protein [Caldilineaceae bacterium]